MAADQSTPGNTAQADVSSEFRSYYLQRATKEFSEDLDQVRNAKDFNNDAIAMLIHALQQGTTMFSEEDQKRIFATGPAEAASAGGKKSP
ncbi:ribosome assembly protein 3 [Phialemonium atrogriseum]|uniref:Ribosome assembly protein 3 n=1 Tax=Phialemonium atrogriseum TaxID=1093897 RepID=A0AAJ0C2Q7_9PEZI|nr:ribosome assembly protein 3 [Phialemonium atrogriseum]KAK1766536.1 ribosome assembly protein 3 [Phialemonium atrogriseum]